MSLMHSWTPECYLVRYLFGAIHGGVIILQSLHCIEYNHCIALALHCEYNHCRCKLGRGRLPSRACTTSFDARCLKQFFVCPVIINNGPVKTWIALYHSISLTITAGALWGIGYSGGRAFNAQIWARAFSKPIRTPRWPGFPNQNLQYNVRQLSFVRPWWSCFHYDHCHHFHDNHGRCHNFEVMAWAFRAPVPSDQRLRDWGADMTCCICTSCAAW